LAQQVELGCLTRLPELALVSARELSQAFYEVDKNYNSIHRK
jgi:hypothetical protein